MSMIMTMMTITKAKSNVMTTNKKRLITSAEAATMKGMSTIKTRR